MIQYVVVLIFELNKEETNTYIKKKNKNKKFGYGIQYLQSILPEYFNSEWSVTKFHFDNDVKTFSIFGKDKLYTIGNNGSFYILNYNNSNIENTYRFISDEKDPFDYRSSTIK